MIIFSSFAVMSWGLNEETGELDTEMIRNWSHRALHEMTVAAKIIVEAVYGTKPAYSKLVPRWWTLT